MDVAVYVAIEEGQHLLGEIACLLSRRHGKSSCWRHSNLSHFATDCGLRLSLRLASEAARDPRGFGDSSLFRRRARRERLSKISMTDNTNTDSTADSGHPAGLMDKLVSLAKRRGFIFQSSEIYGGVGSVYDYGPLGIELKNRIQDLWWREMVYRHPNIVGLDAGILMNPEVWVASGHVGAFTDPLVECRSCHRRFRADDLPLIEAGKPEAQQCAVCGTTGQWTDPRQFNLMFKTFMGVVEDEASTVYLRPETAQGIFVNFRNVQESVRQKVPFGIAQVGKAFRNEITPGNFIFRTREFEQMEMQFFCAPGTEDEWFETWKERRMAWVETLGIRPERLRFHRHGPDELAHYCRDASDIQYRFPFGWQEFEGIHNRTDYDLGRHQEHSGKKLEYFDQPGEPEVRAVRDRDLGGTQPHPSRRAGGRIRRGGRRGPAARRAAAQAPRWRPSTPRSSRS